MWVGWTSSMPEEQDGRYDDNQSNPATCSATNIIHTSRLSGEACAQRLAANPDRLVMSAALIVVRLPRPELTF